MGERDLTGPLDVGLSQDERLALLEIAFSRATMRAQAKLPGRDPRIILAAEEKRLRNEKLEIIRNFYADKFRDRWFRRFERTIQRGYPDFRLGPNNHHYASSRLFRFINRYVARDCDRLYGLSMEAIKRYYDGRQQLAALLPVQDRSARP